ncbi:MAG: energy transducer TonB [Candidatus Sulfotelmatobacter sp.]
MNLQFSYFLVLAVLSAALPAESQTPSVDRSSKSSEASSNSQQSITKIPAGVILVKGAWSSASDSVTPVPEDGTVAKGLFSDPYFGITYTLPQDWTEEYEGPPPSESGRYVLAQIGPAKDGPGSASMLITAQDMFFAPVAVDNAIELTEYTKDHLQNYYKVETAPSLRKLGGREFSFFSYWSPAADLHWYVLAIEIRCHAVQFVLTSRDTKLLDSLMSDLNRVKLQGDVSGAIGGGDVPVCVKDYARDENVITRVDPIFTEHRFNPVPVRIIIDKEGKVKHIHFLNAFPDQAKGISDALGQWRFRPYWRYGQPMEVETGILFGRGVGQASR